jgi:hypothetical protein
MMLEGRRVESFSIRIPRDQALRLMGVRGKRRAPRESLMEVFEEEYATAAEMVRPRAVLRFAPAGLPGSSWIAPDMPLVAVVCTIGDVLEKRVSRLAEQGSAARALVLDSIGSAGAEEVADRSNRLICEMAASTDHVPDCRRSPGYGSWDVREQAAMFRFVQPDEIGVTLTESCMMVPRKSISYVVPLRGGEPGRLPGNRCSRCGAEGCPYREGDGDHEVDESASSGDFES